jgi:hypothetical protein
MSTYDVWFRSALECTNACLFQGFSLKKYLGFAGLVWLYGVESYASGKIEVICSSREPSWISV